MDEDQKWQCPQCGETIVSSVGAGLVFDQMGRNWHKMCWEAFQKEYNDVLDTTDLSGQNYTKYNFEDDKEDNNG